MPCNKRTALFQETFWAPVTANGMSLDQIRKGSFFTREGKRVVAGGGLSYAHLEDQIPPRASGVLCQGGKRFALQGHGVRFAVERSHAADCECTARPGAGLHRGEYQIQRFAHEIRGMA